MLPQRHQNTKNVTLGSVSATKHETQRKIKKTWCLCILVAKNNKENNYEY
jgi:hypothetical protein